MGREWGRDVHERDDGNQGVCFALEGREEHWELSTKGGRHVWMEKRETREGGKRIHGKRARCCVRRNVYPNDTHKYTKTFSSPYCWEDRVLDQGVIKGRRVHAFLRDAIQHLSMMRGRGRRMGKRLARQGRGQRRCMLPAGGTRGTFL